MNFTRPKAEPQPELELDELDDGEESDDDPNVFRIRDKLEEPAHVVRSIRDLHLMIHNGGIDLSPPYQRDVVWPESKQIALIESLFRNVPIPSIIFAIRPSEDNPEEVERVCVDGKQRLTSIQKFCDGQIPYRDPKTKKQWWYTLPDSFRGVRSEIPEKDKDEFSDILIRCIECDGLTPTTERDIFQRVQMGMTLTGAEKLQAISSPWASWICELEAKHVAVDGGLSSVLQWDTKRGRDFQNVAYFVCCCEGLPDLEQIPTAQKMEKWLSRIDQPTKKFKDDIEDVLSVFWRIADNPNLNGGLKTISNRLAPVEFIFIGVLLFVIRNQSIEERAAAITDLRHRIRAQYKDIRINSTVCKFLWGIIRDLKNNPSKTLSRGTTGKKRRNKASSDDEDEYRPSPIHTLGKAAPTRSKPKKTVLS